MIFVSQMFQIPCISEPELTQLLTMETPRFVLTVILDTGPLNYLLIARSSGLKRTWKRSV